MDQLLRSLKNEEVHYRDPKMAKPSIKTTYMEEMEETKD